MLRTGGFIPLAAPSTGFFSGGRLGW